MANIVKGLDGKNIGWRRALIIYGACIIQHGIRAAAIPVPLKLYGKGPNT
jgi:hypothetical protein